MIAHSTNLRYAVIVIFCFSILIAKGQNNDDSGKLSENRRNLGFDLILIDDETKQFSSIFQSSDTWISRFQIYRQSPYNSLSLSYDNVNLNSIIDGSLNYNILPILNTNLSKLDNQINILSNSTDLSTTIYKNSSVDTNQISLNLQGGNLYGATKIGIDGKSDYMFWSAKVDYLTSSNFEVSDKKADSVPKTRFNSEQEQFSTALKIGIDDKNSKISLGFLFNQGKENLANSISEQERLNLRKPLMRTSLLNLEFMTRLNSEMNLFANVYYFNNKNIYEKFDNNSFDSRLFESSFKKTFEEYKYGWNANMNYNAEILPEAIISLNYDRESIRYQSDEDAAVNNYSFERLLLGVRLFDTNSVISYSFSADYKLLNPLTYDPVKLIENFSGFEYSFLLNFHILKNVNLVGLLSRNIMLPAPYLIYPKLNEAEISYSQLDNTINNNFEIGLNYEIDRGVNIKIDYFSSFYENIQLPFSIVDFTIKNYQNKFNSTGLEFLFEWQSDYLYLRFNSNYYFDRISVFDYFAREIVIPKFKNSIYIYKDFDFGLNLGLSAEHISDRESLYDKSYRLDDFFIINFFAEQKIIENNSIFGKVYNLTDTYYELYKSYPMPGMYFVVGINLAL